MGRPFSCPYCETTQSTSKGVRRTKTLGIRHIRRCQGCKRRFTPKHQKPEPAPSEPAAPVLAATPSVQPQPVASSEPTRPSEVPG